jgi:splicing factor 3B subunit 3
MDFGLNDVKRRTSDPIDPSAHRLLMVPFAPDGPGGVVIMCEDFLIYRGVKGVE